MKTTFKNFKLTSTFLNNKLWDCSDSMQNWNNHIITVYNTETKKRTSFEFWGSIKEPEIDNENDLLFAFYCFLSDGSEVDSFEDFCSCFGYDNDSIKAYKIYKKCKRQRQKAERIGIIEPWDIMNELQEKYNF